MTLRLYDTATRSKRDFSPADPERVTMYVCGPTVYDHIHIGNARPLIVFDLLARLLRRIYPKVLYARNLTDIDDKILARAEQEGCDFQTVTGRYIDSFHGVCAQLGGLEVDVEPRATETLPAMRDMIHRLLDSGHAYVAQGHVLFSVEHFDGYGALSGRRLEEMHAGARVEVADYKRQPGDFVLWKPSDENQPGWDSPWGRGRPGWHLECSCMISEHLGPTIDLHGGGMDLVFPHHENERAQSCCAWPGERFVRHWMHNGYVSVDGEKMAKSVGNVVLVHELLQDHPGELLRLSLLHAHYRKPLDWTAGLLVQARSALDRLYRAWQEAGAPQPGDAKPHPDLLDALQDDLNTPLAIQCLQHEATRLQKEPDHDAACRLAAGAQLLGLLTHSPAQWFHSSSGEAAGSLDEEQIERLVAERACAREKRDFAEADRIRETLAQAGIIVEDQDGTCTWRRVQ